VVVALVPVLIVVDDGFVVAGASHTAGYGACQMRRSERLDH
jgi:hypothetical protein